MSNWPDRQRNLDAGHAIHEGRVGARGVDDDRRLDFFATLESNATNATAPPQDLDDVRPGADGRALRRSSVCDVMDREGGIGHVPGFVLEDSAVERGVVVAVEEGRIVGATHGGHLPEIEEGIFLSELFRCQHFVQNADLLHQRDDLLRDVPVRLHQVEHADLAVLAQPVWIPRAQMIRPVLPVADRLVSERDARLRGVVGPDDSTAPGGRALPDLALLLDDTDAQLHTPGQLQCDGAAEDPPADDDCIERIGGRPRGVRGRHAAFTRCSPRSIRRKISELVLPRTSQLRAY